MYQSCSSSVDRVLGWGARIPWFDSWSGRFFIYISFKGEMRQVKKNKNNNNSNNLRNSLFYDRWPQTKIIKAANKMNDQSKHTVWLTMVKGLLSEQLRDVKNGFPLVAKMRHLSELVLHSKIIFKHNFPDLRMNWRINPQFNDSVIWSHLIRLD